MGQINPWNWLYISSKRLGSFVISVRIRCHYSSWNYFCLFPPVLCKKEKNVLLNSLLNVVLIIESKEQVFPSIFSSQEKESTAKFAEFSFQNKCFAFAIKED